MTDEAAPASPPDEAAPNSRKGAALAAPIRRWAGVIGGAAVAERERWVLWLPAALGVGIALYFTLRAEPPLWLGPTWLALASACVFATRRWPGARVAAIAATVVGLGFAVAQWNALAWHAPILTQRIGPVVLTGRVLEASALPTGQRLVLDRLDLARGGDQKVLPERVRVTVRSGDIVSPGDRVRLRAVLMPPPSPALPGSFDFRRYAYFKGLGAVGYAVSKVTRMPRSEAAAAALSMRGFKLQVERLRHRIGGRVHSALPGSPGAVAAALMTGDRGAIPRADLAAMRDSGLAHLLAISGLHIGLLAALLFFTVRGLLALVAWLALRYPIKKWAAAAALIGALGYLLITGLTIPTQRAFLMTGIALFAVMLDRAVISMGLAAWAAVVVLLASPHSLLGPSFQLSFAAVVALMPLGLEEWALAPMGWGDRAGSWGGPWGGQLAGGGDLAACHAGRRNHPDRLRRTVVVSVAPAMAACRSGGDRLWPDDDWRRPHAGRAGRWRRQAVRRALGRWPAHGVFHAGGPVHVGNMVAPCRSGR